MPRVSLPRCAKCGARRDSAFKGNRCRPCFRAANRVYKRAYDRAARLLRPPRRISARDGTPRTYEGTPFLLTRTGYAGRPCYACGTPLAPGGHCVGCGVMCRGAA